MTLTDQTREIASALPNYHGGCLANLVPTVCRLFGAPAEGLLPGLLPDRLPPALLDGARRVVLFLIDGLGMNQLLAGMDNGDAPTLAELARSHGHLSSIDSVVPSATMAALASMQTGVAPNRHAILGWTMFLEEFGEVVEMARWGPVSRPGTSYQDAALGRHDPLAFFRHRTVYQRLAAAGVRSFVVNPLEYRGSALSRMLFAGAEEVGYRLPSGLGVNLELALERLGESAPGYVYVYYPGLDLVSHLAGPCSPEHAAELALIDSLLGRWLARARRDGRTLALLTADHGHVATPREHTVFVDRDQRIMERLRAAPNGERRLLYLHVGDGNLATTRELVERAWGHGARVYRAAELFEQEWFGPGEPSEAARRRAGDLVVVAQGDWQFTAGPSADRPARLFQGNHGALHPHEVQVPLLAWRL